ncbi:MAG: type IX secretion system membrane protein PorP/SprF [Dysgonamonadaceae bacterium]|jgi:type IX secretion system PorP/SprF family membrane protein|nr:type IX secretion system membrane protein PorP/SprF [Dysgonamonadaceae bacterium]
MRLLLTVIPAIICITNANAQFDMQMTNYWAAIGYLNPAYAGQTETLDATALTRMQWLGITNAPKSTVVTVSMPYELMGHKHGLGGKMYSDKAGLFSVSMFAGQYAWTKKMLKGTLRAGLEIGQINQTFDGTKIEIPEDEYHQQTDQAIPTSLVNGKSIDASLGIIFTQKKWFAGISVAHLLAPKIDLTETNIYEIPRTYYLVNGYNIILNNPLLELRPMIILKTMEMSALYLESDSNKTETNNLKAMMRNSQIDASVRLHYNDRFWAGLTWRNGDAIGVMLGMKIKMLEAGYAYDFPISVLRSESTGSHELFLRYRIDINLKKKKKDKHKSVRFL